MNFKIEKLSSKYKVRQITDADIPTVLALYEGNPAYFKFCPPTASEATVREDMTALPKGKRAEDKHFVGFFLDDKLVAVMDLIEKYPDEETAFIGFFMVAKERQGNGVGGEIISDCLQNLKRSGYSFVRLGYVKTNTAARKFWLKNGFSETGKERKSELYTVVEMIKKL